MSKASQTIIEKFSWLYNILLNAMVAAGAAMMVFMMLSIGGSVIFRRSGVDFAWALEVSEYLLIIATLFGAGWLFRTGGHIRVDVVYAYLHGRTREIYNAIIFTIVALVCLSFTIIGIQSTREAYLSNIIEEKVYLTFPKWVLLGLFPLSGFFMSVESIKSAVDHFKKCLHRKRSDQGHALQTKTTVGTSFSGMPTEPAAEKKQVKN